MTFFRMIAWTFLGMSLFITIGASLRNDPILAYYGTASLLASIILLYLLLLRWQD